MNKESIILKLKDSARKSWSGIIGEGRAEELERFVRGMIDNYSTVLGFSEDDILTKIEERRDYSAINYYQECNFPRLENVEIFETMQQLRDKFPSRKFTCPRCKSVSTDPNTCNSGKDIGNGKRCDWKSWGLFRTLGQGYRFVVKEDFLNNPVIYEIFRPIELELD